MSPEDVYRKSILGRRGSTHKGPEADYTFFKSSRLEPLSGGVAEGKFRGAACKVITMVKSLD